MHATTDSQLPIVDFLDPAFRLEPFTRFAELFATDHHVAIDATGSSYLLFRFEDVSTALRDPRIGVNDFAPPFGEPTPLFEFLQTQLLAYDPPEHTRLRRLMNRAFTPRRVRELRGHVEELVRELLDAVPPTGSLRLVEDLSFPMPVIVICEMLGVDPADRNAFTGWSADLAAAFDPIFDRELLARADAAVLGLRAHIERLISDQARTADGILADLVAAEEAGDRLSHEELVCNTLLLLFAGHETTKNLIANAMYALLRHPAQLAALRDDRSLLPTAIEEALRFDPPVGLIGRVVTEEITFGDTTLRPGDRVALSIMAANRDPAVNDDPDTFDIRRTDPSHVSFGVGAHFCLGASLARMEAEVAFDSLLDRYDRIALDGDAVDRQESFVLRGVEELTLRVREREA